jgi:hypothetical protein
MVVNDPIEFLHARGHLTDHLTDYEIQDAFAAAFKNRQHDLVEQAFFIGLPWITKPADWRRYCDELHAAIETGGRGSCRADVAERLLTGFTRQGVPIAN